MCEQCQIVSDRFIQTRNKFHKDYNAVLGLLEELEKAGRIELLAGDCLLKDATEALDSEQHFTVCHYLKCRQCGQVFFFGACIRGAPIYKLIDDFSIVNLDRMLWGKAGTCFQNKR